MKSTNFIVNSGLQRKARDYRIHLSKALEQQLTEMLLEKKRKAWAGMESRYH